MLRLTRRINMCVDEALECRILALNLATLGCWRRRWYYCAAALLCTSLRLNLRRVLSICKYQDPFPLFSCGIISEYALFGFQMPVENFRGAVVHSSTITIRSREQHQLQDHSCARELGIVLASISELAAVQAMQAAEFTLG